MGEYNLEEIRRFGERVEEQTSNFQVATDNIDYIFRDMCDVLKKYTYEQDSRFAAQEFFQTQHGHTYNLSTQANAFGDGWMSTRNNMKNELLRMSAAMLGFYDFSKATALSSAQEISMLADQFKEYYEGKEGSTRDSKKLYWKVSKAPWSTDGKWTGPDYGSIDTDLWD